MHSIKHNRSRVVLFGALIAGLSFAAGPAAASTFYLDGAAGHLWLSSGEAIYRDAQNDIGGNNLVRIVDGRKVKLTTPNATGPEGTRTWVIHIPLNSSNVNWNVTPRGSDGDGTVGQNGTRVCSFTSSGAFSGCGAPVFMNQTSTVFVPSAGTAFSQTTLTDFITLGIGHPSLTLSSIQANT